MRLAGRVVQLTSVHRPDDPRIYLKEAASLAANGYEVILVASGTDPGTNPAIRFVSIARARGRIARMTVTSALVLRRAWKLRASVYHIHDPELIPVGLLLRAGGARVIYDAHEDLPSQIEYKEYLPRWSRGVLALLAGAIEKLFARLVDGVVAATPTIAARFPAQSTVLVRNYPLETEFLGHEPSPYASRPPRVVYLGRITEAAGGLMMAAAAAIVARTHEVEFVFAGPCDPALEERIRKLGDQASVRLPGWVDRQAAVELLDQARIGLVLFQPLRNYVAAYPTKLFEYMASAVPIVGSDFPVWREIVGDVNCGVLVDPRNPDAIAAAITGLLDDPGAASEMGARGRHAALRTYRWKTEEDALLALYRRVSKPRTSQT